MADWLEEAQHLHGSSLVVDGHADTAQRFVDDDWQWTASSPQGGQLSAASARAGGLHAEFFAIWAEPETWAGCFHQRTLQLLDAVHEQARRFPESFAICTTTKEVRAAKASGRFAAMLGIEGGHSIENSLVLLRTYFQLGARYMTLTWNNTNDWCDSSGDAERHGGLTAFGREVIGEMNRLGMLVDVSHVSDAAFFQVLKMSAAPVIASHSSARAVTAAPRNLSDEMVRALAKQGGVVMVNFFSAFIDEAWRAAWNAQRPEREAAERSLRLHYRERGEPLPFSAQLRLDRTFAEEIVPAPLTSLIDHFDHLLRVAGTDHVGIGSDFDGIPCAPDGIGSAADLPRITAGLLQRGWRSEELRGLLGENILRVLDEAGRAACA